MARSPRHLLPLLLLLLASCGCIFLRVSAEEPAATYPHSSAPLARGDLLADLEFDVHIVTLKAMVRRNHAFTKRHIHARDRAAPVSHPERMLTSVAPCCPLVCLSVE
jgi:hypothetical protein